jgi:membrane-associated protease RseP (regulator of RpoE activity)
MADLYAPSGVFSFLGNDGYWITVNCFYWVFWINLMLGLTNALPAVPLDGGFVLKDLIKEAFIRGKRRKIGLNGMLSDRPGLTEEQLDKIVGSIVIAASLIILFLILWQLIGPRLGL